jgi:RNase P subunit RPR2
MMYPKYVRRRMICPNCGAEERVRFEYSLMIVTSPCSQCKVMIRWKHKPDGSGGELRTAFDDYEPEIASH